MAATDFESEAYWDERYSDPKKRRSDFFDWYLMSFSALEPHLGPLIREAICECRENVSVAVVDVGCGNSPFVRDAAKWVHSSGLLDEWMAHAADNEKHLKFVGSDFSRVVIDQQRSSPSDMQIPPRTSIHFDVADARESLGSSVPAGQVALVMDKATLDAVDCSGNTSDTDRVIETCFRYLVEGGYFVSLTCRPVGRRMETIKHALDAHEIYASDPVILQLNPQSPSNVFILRKLRKESR